jgi:hypothetical protein
VRAVLVLGAVGAAAWAVAVVTAASAVPHPGCRATTVRYEPAKHPSLGDVPWLLGQPERAGVAVFVLSQADALRDGRVNRSDGVVLWQSGTRLVWHVDGPAATVAAERLGGGARFRIPLVGTEDGLAASPRFPSAGCWRLTVRAGELEASVTARVVPRPRRIGCDATPVGDTSLTAARPREAGIAGGSPWRTADDRLLMYTHGVGPGDLSAKVPWWTRDEAAPSLELTGIRLDSPGHFTQEFPQAGNAGSRPPGYRAVYPSIVDVPAAGCWLLRLRAAQRGAVLVVRAVDR